MPDTERAWPEPFLADVIAGLTATPKTLPSQYFYDERGSELFDDITRLPEYYLTRTETNLLQSEADSIATAIGPNACIVEYGAGGLQKIRLLLPQLKDVTAFVPIDVSGPFLFAAAKQLAADFPNVLVEPRIGSFLELDMGIELPVVTGKRIGFFPGSTLGNLDDDAIRHFFRSVRSQLGMGSAFLLGVDTNQDPVSLIPAYDDAAGVTAEFNLNMLAHINRELGGTFKLDDYRHEARWNHDESRIEMHLVAQADQCVEIGDQAFCLNAGESIHTENSRKFSDGQLRALLAGTGWSLDHAWRSPDHRVSLFWLESELVETTAE